MNVVELGVYMEKSAKYISDKNTNYIYKLYIQKVYNQMIKTFL